MSIRRDRPLMIFDGDCHFCTRWIQRWKDMTGERVEYVKSQSVVLPPGVTAEHCAQSVQFVDESGARFDRALAVFLTLERAGWFGGLLVKAYRHVPGFAFLADAMYRIVAANRTVFSRATRVLWGRDVRPPTYAVSSAIFLRLLGLIYLIAFVSFGVQAAGLIGPHGILPVAHLVPRVREALGADAWREWPSLVLAGDPDQMVAVLLAVGVVASAMILADVASPLALTVAWICHLSLVVAGQDFYSFQWDALLLETGLLSIFLAGWSWIPGFRLRRPPRLAHFALVWLLFRLMFSSGVVKLSSGDPTWAHLTALDYHYWTQPIPNPISWFAAQAPEWFQRFSCAVMFVIELGLPFLVFLPRRPRLLAFLGFTALSLLIELTGNYGYFNLLTFALAVLLIDDTVWPRFLCEKARSSPRVAWSRWPSIPLVGAYCMISLVPLVGTFRAAPGWIQPLLPAYEAVVPFRSINGYGLFAVMTTTRPEIEIQGSMDGVNWKPYRFKYKPGALNRPPPFVAPYMPRLDWQMWFAALGPVNQSPWMLPFVARLLQGDPEVLALLDHDPFEGSHPRYLRAMLNDYHFTSWKDANGNWWRSEPRAIYFSDVSFEQLFPEEGR